MIFFFQNNDADDINKMTLDPEEMKDGGKGNFQGDIVLSKTQEDEMKASDT